MCALTLPQQALRGLEDAGYPTGTVEAAHTDLPDLDRHQGERVVELLARLDDAALDRLTEALRDRSCGERS